MKKLLIIVLLSFSQTAIVYADDTWTDVGVYAFMTDVDGDVEIGNVTSDVDVPFKDILENLDFGFMGYVEHRRGKWSFIGDIFYADISVDDTVASNAIASVELDVVLKQVLAEGYVGYRVLERKDGAAYLGVDVLAGIRYNKIDVDIGAEINVLSLSAAASRSADIDWTDAVVGVRAQYDFGNGWGITGLADIGEGSDSKSYQLMGFVNYQYSDDLKLFGGYRHYHLEQDETVNGLAYKLDLDYAGPMFGISKRF